MNLLYLLLSDSYFRNSRLIRGSFDALTCHRSSLEVVESENFKSRHFFILIDINRQHTIKYTIKCIFNANRFSNCWAVGIGLFTYFEGHKLLFFRIFWRFLEIDNNFVTSYDIYRSDLFHVVKCLCQFHLSRAIFNLNLRIWIVISIFWNHQWLFIWMDVSTR